MFYLLKDNRIIDSQKEDVYAKEYQGHKWLFKNNEHKTCLGLIKSQSENVFDLINKKEDLVKIDGQIVMAKTINGDLRNLSGISAIYKPDDKGNYIKVWERKENE